MARIVVADDDADLRRLVTLVLSRAGHEVTALGDGAQALAACREETPALVVLDVTMPVMTGLEALAEIRADAELAALPVIVLTGWEPRTGDDPATTYVTKPFSGRELTARVEELLG